MKNNQRQLLTLVICIFLGLSGFYIYKSILSATPPHSTSDYIEFGDLLTNKSKIYRVALTSEGRKLFKQGLELIKTKKYPQAEDLFLKVSQLEPNSPCIFEQLGRIALLQNKNTKALEWFAQAYALAKIDPYLSNAIKNWANIAQQGSYNPISDELIDIQFPGQLAYFIEHRLRPKQEGFYGASYNLIGDTRFAFPTPTYLPFEIITQTPNGHGTIVFGSSRAREGFKPKAFLEQLSEKEKGKYSPAVNLGRSQSAPLFWRQALQYIKSQRTDDAHKRHAIIFLTDPESLSDLWLHEFHATPLDPIHWTEFKADINNTRELWPSWSGLSNQGKWRIPNNWQDLAKDPIKNGLNNEMNGTAYQYPGDGTVNIENFKAALELASSIASNVYVVDIATSPNQYEQVIKASSAPTLKAISNELGITYIHQPPEAWGLDERHFFGAKGYPIEKMDWWHLNYEGANIFSKKLANILSTQ